ncbi:MFS transporter [Candidatus Annandia pinicola]|uniref:MFS transporter n=1 Tax=Candidatus Annandia pinicola TaxID=1345117 RepID=UPI001D0084B9|nr:MFS transporter [Candidatus Annandia pinicola]UDG80368.1 Inner membrane transport protein YajR [Candidatus Annandia pinicola]
MNKNENKTIISLITVFILRMSGILMLLPIMNMYLPTYSNKSNLISIAISIYGLLQILFQIPYGILSDIMGRKPVIKLGLIIFMIGSIVASCSNNIYIIILGRIIQGSGAINTIILLLISDLIQEESIPKAMAALNILLFFTYLSSLIIGPMIACIIGLRSLFFFMSILSLIAFFVLLYLVPEEYPIYSKFNFRNKILKVINNLQLLKINFSVLFLHLLLNIMFLNLSNKLTSAGFDVDEHWQMYLIEIFIALFLAIPIIKIIEIFNSIKKAIINIIILTFFIFLILWKFNKYLWLLILSVQIFFIIFNLLESVLPSMINRESSLLSKGAAMSLYSTFQLLGSFSGSIISKYIKYKFNIDYLFMATLVLIIIWLLIILTIEEPLNKSNVCIQLNRKLSHVSINKLFNNKGILEAHFSYNKNFLYLKINNTLIKKKNIKDIIIQQKK